jgi:hypothetical protein
MRYIPSTAEIVLFKMLGRSVDERWVNWAYDMLLAGFETEELVILAGEHSPFDQFGLQRLTDKIFSELGLAFDNEKTVYKNYICYLLNEVILGNRDAVTALNSIQGIYLENYDRTLQPFAELYWAYEDLIYSDTQYYWDGATRGNIRLIIREYFVKWQKENCA